MAADNDRVVRQIALGLPSPPPMEGGLTTRWVRVVCMGDSITFGQYVDPRLRWTTLLEARLRKAFPEVGLDVLNQGVNGEQTRMGLERFPAAVQEHEPHVVTIQYGLNDCNCWQTDRGLPRVSEPAFAANLVEMIARARHVGTRHVVLSTNHRTRRWTTMPNGEAYERSNERYSVIVREVAAEADVILCDVRAAWEDYSDEELAELLLPPPDNLHLSERGHVVQAELLAPLVEAGVRAVLTGAVVV
jgi:lysophospholipase L1-like esterase